MHREREILKVQPSPLVILLGRSDQAFAWLGDGLQLDRGSGPIRDGAGLEEESRKGVLIGE